MGHLIRIGGCLKFILFKKITFFIKKVLLCNYDYLNYNKSSDKVLDSEVQAKGTTTIHGTIGDTFAWLCVVVLIFWLD